MNNYLLTNEQVEEIVGGWPAYEATIESLLAAEHQKHVDEGWKSPEEARAMGFAKAYYLDPLAGGEAIRKDERAAVLREAGEWLQRMTAG